MEVQYSWLNSGKQPSNAVIGEEQQQIVDQLHAPLYNTTRRGRVFCSSTTPLGVAIPIYTSVTPLGNVLWNPIGSGVKAVLLDYSALYVSGASVNGVISLYARNGVGSVIASGAAAGQFTAFADTVPVNGRMGLVNSIPGTGGGETSKVRSSNAGTCTFTAGVAAEAVQHMFTYNQALSASAQGTIPVLPATFDFRGRVHVYPGTVVWVASNLASVSLFAQSLSWEEIDLATSA